MIPRRIWTGEDNKVSLRRPPAGGHPNTCECRDSGKGVVADTYEARGQDPSLGLESHVEHVTDKTQHEAGP